ncbi:Putative Get1 family, helix hairpin bin domain superfamily protein [Septoria linicola]|uniref:Get1 family, helix hairpin bin domain superfamily protein n=1 Tax=Septoria linicola TaxID=215465 RepID=A0A9Q9ERM8_9PEZI|nr:Putative Get1 family, helix hairpin bin domain superfamily protein [Septoria linicola]
MPSVLLVVFVVQLLLSLISTVGASAVNDLAWYLFSLLPTPQSKAAQENLKLRNEVVRLERQMRAVSAQDEFAKWAKIRRQHDKAKDKYEKEASASQSFKSTFISIVSKLRWLGTQGVNFLLNTYYSKTPMFWLPQGWVPYYAEWVLSFPRAPLGGVSVNVWAIACGSVIAMVTELAVAAWALKEGKVQEGKNKGEKVKMEGMKIPASTPLGAGASKKEL